MAKCPAILVDGNYQNFGQVTTKLVDVIGMYNSCAARHNDLVDFETQKVN